MRPDGIAAQFGDCSRGKKETRYYAAAISEVDTEAVLKAFPQGNSRDSGREEYASSWDQ